MLDEVARHQDFKRYLLGRRQVSAYTAYLYELDIRRIERTMATYRADITAEILDRFLELPGLSWGTKSRSVLAFRLWHEWGARRGLWPLDPEISEIRLSKRPPETETLPLSLEESRTLLALATTPLRQRLVLCGLYAGMRFAEIQNLDGSYFRTTPGGLGVLEFVGKGSKRRQVPRHPMIEAHREAIVSARCTRNQLLECARELRDLARIEHFTTRSLRRTFSEALSELGSERTVIGALLGHSPTTVTEAHYAPPRMPELVEAIGRLSY